MSMKFQIGSKVSDPWVGEVMDVALSAARAAGERGDIPIGAAVFSSTEIIAVAGNERELKHDPTAHAEIVALREAATKIGNWRLSGLSLCVTLEPCPMCAGALVKARLDSLVYGASDPKAGAAGSLYNICQDKRLNHQLDITSGVKETEAAQILNDFFAGKRT